jgi:hypothetical protein
MPEYPAGYDFPVASLARWILAKIEETYEAAVLAGHATALPERRLLAIGAIAVDSPQLAVMFGGISVGPPGQEPTTPMRANQPRTAAFNIELWRPINTSAPGGLEPAPAIEVSGDSEVVMQDSWLLLESSYKCDQLGIGVIASVVVNEPQGEMVGCSMGLELQIP